jgi:hypothetical protein
MRPLTLAGLLALLILACACANQKYFHSTIDSEDCRELADKRKIRKGKNPKVTPATVARPRRKSPLIDDKSIGPSPFPDHHITENQTFFASTVHEPIIFHNSQPLSNDRRFDLFYGEKILTDEPECLPLAVQELDTDRETTIHSEQPKNRRMTNILGISGAVAAFSLLTLSLFRSRAMKISAWAAHHPRTTKTILAAIHTATGLGAVGVGAALAGEGSVIIGESIGISAALAAVAATAYPRKTKDLQHFSRHYLQQKACDVALFVTGATMIAGISNQVYSNNPDLFTSYAVSMPLSQSMSAQTGDVAADVTFSDPTQAQDPPKKNKAGMKVLAISLFVIFTLGVSALSCAIACSGQGVLAVVTLVALETLLVLLLNSALRNIDGTTRKKKAKEPEAIPQT